MTLNIQIQNQVFTLHQSGALFWKEKSMLLISDAHLGKVSHFRKHGMAIPHQAAFENIKKLTNVVEFFKPGQLVFMGDLFHSKINNEWNWFAEWTKTVSATLVLIEGNHDIIARKNYSDLNIDYFSELCVEGFIFTHHPEIRENAFNFCGHIHPGIKLNDIGRQALKLPCFFQRPNQMILPAFGEFTGIFYIKPKEGDVVYAITEAEVILIGN